MSSVGDVSFVVTGSGDVVVAESLQLFDDSEFDEERLAFSVIAHVSAVDATRAEA